MAYAGRTYESRWDRGGGPGADAGGALAPGKRSLVAQAYRSAVGTTPPVAGEQQAAVVGKAALSSGVALPDELRAQLERALGVSLDGVRLHDDAASHAAAAAIGARAYAAGQNIHFAQGTYRPNDPEGQRLIAHEVAHTVQQKGAAQPAVQNKLEVSQPGDAAEVEADRFADAFAAGQPAAPITATPSADLHRDPAPTPPLLKLLGIKIPDPVDIEGAPPHGSGEKVKYSSFWFSDNQEYVRFELSEWASRRQPNDVDGFSIGFEHYIKENPDYFYNTASKDDAEKEARRGYLNRVLGIIRIEEKELKFRISSFRDLFERRCGDVVRESLAESRKKLESERDRYGIKSESSWLFWTKHSMQDNDATKQMRAALSAMRESYTKVSIASNQFLMATPDGQAKQKQAIAEYNAVRYAKESQFPVIATFDLDASHGEGTLTRLHRLIDYDIQEMADHIGADIVDKLKNIKTVEEKLSTKKDLVWKLERAHGATLCLPDVMNDKLTHEKLRAKVVTHKRAEVADDEAFMKAALVAIGVALALVPMVGPPAAAATAAVAAGAAVNIAVAAQSIRDAQLTAAAQDTDFNKAKAVLGGEPPSLFWLAMDMIIIGVELKAAAMAVKSIARLHEAAVAARATAKATKGAEAEGKLKELLDRLRAEGDAVKGAEGKLGQKLVDDVNKTEGFAQQNGAKPVGGAGGAEAVDPMADTVRNGVAFAGEGEAVGVPRWEQQGQFLIATRTQNGLMMRLNHAEGLYFDVLVRNPGREAGIFRNAATGEHVVGYGTTWEFLGPQNFGKGGNWELVRHYHPYKARTSRIASSADFNVMISPQNGIWNRPASSVIDWFDSASGTWRQTTIGFEPGTKEVFWLRFQDEAGGWHNLRFRDLGTYDSFVNQYKLNPNAIPADGALPSAVPGRWTAPPTPLPGEPRPSAFTPEGPAHAVPPAANTNAAPAAGQVDNTAGAAGGMAQPAAKLPPQRVLAHHGHRTIVIPGEYVMVQSDDKVIVFQLPGAKDEADSIRIMREGGSKKYPYPHGYVKWHNKSNQPLNAAGKPGSKADTHFPLGPDDPLVPGLVEK